MTRSCLIFALAFAVGCASASGKDPAPERRVRSPGRIVRPAVRCGPYSCPPPKAGFAPAPPRRDSVPFPTCGNGELAPRELPRGAF